MNNLFTFPDLFSKEKNGKTRVWKASVYEREGPNGIHHAYAVIHHGQLDGKLQETVREYTTGKNIGKKNETTPYQQCLQETERKWKDKKEKEGYVELENSKDKGKYEMEKTYLPMLANTYTIEKQKKNGIVFPCYVQPKLDGLRCVVYKQSGHIVYQSRTAGYFDTLSHLTAFLQPIFKKYPHTVLDGELYTTEIPFEELAGLIKKKKISNADQEKLKMVQYHIYDLIDQDLFFEDRHRLIDHIFNEFSLEKDNNSPLKKVHTTLIDDIPSFKEQFTTFVQEGYEGIMLRNRKGLYRCNYRSNDLQKYKEFFEMEYPIINFTQGDGRDKGAVIWVCKTIDEKEFHVRPKGTMEQRQKWFENGSRYIGKMLTVIYQELSEKGVPRFPVGKAIRDYE